MKAIFDIYPNGIISTENIDLPACNTYVYFNLPSEMSARAKIYVIIDNELREHKNGSQMLTPRTGFNRFLPLRPNMGNVIVIDPAKKYGSECGLNTTFFTIGPNNRAIKVNTESSIDFSFYISDCNMLAAEYLSGRVDNPYDAVKEALRDALYNIQEYMDIDASAIDMVNTVNQNSLMLSNKVKNEVANLLPWVKLTNCRVISRVTNIEEIEDKYNEHRIFLEGILTKFMDTICDIYKTPVIPDQMVQIMSAYLSSNPGGVSKADLVDACNLLVSMAKRSSPQDILNVFVSTSKQLK